jgi:NADH:ubiquinone oxidoreductase subunit 4 (subunit M)
MYFIIGIYGSRDRRIKASYYLFLYTLVSSILMFLAILFLYFKGYNKIEKFCINANVLTVLEERIC